MAKGKANGKKNLPANIKFVEGTEVAIPPDLYPVQKGQRPPEEEIIKLSRFICELYATNKFPLAECLKAAGVGSEATFFRWCKNLKAVKELYETAKMDKSAIYRTQLRELATTSLAKQITGYKIGLEEVTETVEVVEGETEEGKPNGIATEVITARTVRTKQVYVKPSATATIFVLSNLDKGNFQRNPSIEDKEGDFPVNIPPIEWVENPAKNEGDED